MQYTTLDYHYHIYKERKSSFLKLYKHYLFANKYLDLHNETTKDGDDVSRSYSQLGLFDCPVGILRLRERGLGPDQRCAASTGVTQVPAREKTSPPYIEFSLLKKKTSTFLEKKELQLIYSKNIEPMQLKKKKNEMKVFFSGHPCTYFIGITLQISWTLPYSAKTSAFLVPVLFRVHLNPCYLLSSVLKILCLQQHLQHFV